jgi:polyferredoxin
MPSDPVKAVWWFMHWLLKVLVRFFWLPILGMVVYEIVINLRVSGIAGALIEGGITLLVGAAVWGILYLILLFTNIGTGLQQVVSDINRFQQGSLYQRPPSSFMDAMRADTEREPEDHVVEGTITDLEQERNKRRRD